MYSAGLLGLDFDVGKMWQDRCHDQSLLHLRAIGDRVGHILAKEAPYRTATEIATFWKTLYNR